MIAYYNEIDGYCCDWLSNLMDAGHITPGRIDDRSIVDVSPDDVRGCDRVHWFAGIAGWDLALQFSGWGNDPVWTGSCPCQPFSVAGKGRASDDERHLWPAFRRLIAECRPPVVFGEQVAGIDGLEWLAGVRVDLERADYAVGAADLPAAGVGSPQKRQRLYWVANAANGRWRAHWNAVHGQDRGCSGPSFWADFERVPRDGRLEGTWRVEPGTKPLAPRIPCYLDVLRAYGNSIVPPLAARFVRAYLDARDGA